MRSAAPRTGPRGRRREPPRPLQERLPAPNESSSCVPLPPGVHRQILNLTSSVSRSADPSAERQVRTAGAKATSRKVRRFTFVAKRTHRCNRAPVLEDLPGETRKTLGPLTHGPGNWTGCRLPKREPRMRAVSPSTFGLTIPALPPLLELRGKAVGRQRAQFVCLAG